MSQSSEDEHKGEVEKRYSVTDVVFDLDCVVGKVRRKIWYATDEEELCDKISDWAGFAVKSFEYEEVVFGVVCETVEGDGESDGELVELVKEMKDITLGVAEASSPEFRAKMLAELKLLGNHDLRVVIEISRQLISTKNEAKRAEKKEEEVTRKKLLLAKIALPKPTLSDYVDNINGYNRAMYWWGKFHNPKCRHYTGVEEEEAGAKE